MKVVVRLKEINEWRGKYMALYTNDDGFRVRRVFEKAEDAPSTFEFEYDVPE